MSDAVSITLMVLPAVRRHWFKDRDGTYYRNVPLVLDEEACTFPLRWWRRSRLLREVERMYQHGHTRTDRLRWWQVEVKPMPMRLAYPDSPVFWTLDESP